MDSAGDWEQIADSNLGTAFVVNPSLIVSFKKKKFCIRTRVISDQLRSETKNLLVITQSFAWGKNPEKSPSEAMGQITLEFAFSRALAKTLENHLSI